VLIFGFVGLFNPIRDGFQHIFLPIQVGLRRSAVNLKDTTQLFFNFNRIRKDNLNLISEIVDLKSQLIEAQLALEENKILRDQLELKNSGDFNGDLLLASVMGNPSDLSGGTVYISEGSHQGINVGDNVVVGNNLIGIVDEVGGTKSKVILTTSSRFRAVAKDLVTHTEGLAVGNFDTTVGINKILVGDSVNTGDVFVTSGADGIYFPGLIIGYVSQVNLDSAKPLKSAILEVPLSVGKLDKVFVILNR